MGWKESRIGSIWHNMKTRCNNPNYDKYKFYGEKGITVCDEWTKSYEIFKEWAVKNGYEENLTLDRIDNKKGYSPDNCRWVSQKEQANNRTSNIFIEYNGKTLTIAELAEKTDIKYETLRRRIRRGWSIEQALNEPTRKTHIPKLITYKGKTKRLYEWAEELNIPYKTLHARIARGWNVDKALTN